ncbi:MAG TPA: ASCH domain-containing protein [Verrucomicrobiota bacterium]|nr:ASCH domain-containing protein [Verrucomicrobiota bacterium]
MNALTLRPHWAWLVVNGYKDIENRSWPTRLRGHIWIHASSSRLTHREYDRLLQIWRERRIEGFPGRVDFRTGGIVGSVEIVDCVTESQSYWFSGNYGFLLKNARPASFRPMKGRLGFFEVAPRRTPMTTEHSDMNNYVAYHSTEVMGYEYGRAKGKGGFAFLSRKSRTYLEKAIGSDVWVLTGTRNKARKMIYRLAAVYQPDAVKEYGDAFQIVGKRGRIFKPPVALNDQPWFQVLLREQNRFSFGFSRIQSEVVIAALNALAG